MTISFTRRCLLAATIAAGVGLAAGPAFAQSVTLRMSTVATETDQRSVALEEVFGPAVAEFATYEPHYNGTLFKQATEIEAIARGNLEMAIISAQELATFFPEFSCLPPGTCTATPPIRWRCSTIR
jgi:TRAP-type transport system periplasmic protein